uniref:Nod factor perception 2 n=1 Tax=Parasponia rigida TaxID=3477 RepID=A0A221I0S2_PARRI|nr:nod factor perception 2 [Parasponia rigida]
MADSYFPFQAIFLLLLLFSTLNMAASQLNNSATDFSCSDSPPSCEAYVAYFSQPPNYMNVGNISDLFGISQALIAKSSNLVSKDSPLIPQQLLLIPLTCTCTGNHYFANITYQVEPGDTYHYLSTVLFENLTNSQVMIQMNPEISPEYVLPYIDIIIPVFCRCPSKSHLKSEIQQFITYVWQPNDQVSNVSAKFNTSASEIVNENKYNNFSSAVGLPVLIPVSKLPVLARVKPPKSVRSKKQWILIGVESLGGIVLITLFATLLVYSNRLLKKRRKILEARRLEPRIIIQDKLLSGVSEYLGRPIMYDNKMVVEGTMDFSEQCRIGGSVYRGEIYGEVFAVKKTKQDITDELNLLQKVNHVNLVNLMGASYDTDGNRFLVYEYVENGSLERWLDLKPSSLAAASSSSSVQFLSWSQRIQIALDVANGLQYLHEHTQPNIAHWNIRTSTILLDSKFRAKIANFEVARPVGNPAMLKVDIFAFGIVLLALVSGKKALQTIENGEVIMLWKDLAKEVFEVEEKKEERLRKWMDPNLQSFYPIDGALSLSSLARACIREKSSARPKMAEIVFSLSVLAQSSSPGTP